MLVERFRWEESSDPASSDTEVPHEGDASKEADPHATRSGSLVYADGVCCLDCKPCDSSSGRAGRRTDRFPAKELDLRAWKPAQDREWFEHYPAWGANVGSRELQAAPWSTRDPVGEIRGVSRFIQRH